MNLFKKYLKVIVKTLNIQLISVWEKTTLVWLWSQLKIVATVCTVCFAKDIYQNTCRGQEFQTYQRSSEIAGLIDCVTSKYNDWTKSARQTGKLQVN